MSEELLKNNPSLYADSGTYDVLKRVGLTGATAHVYLIRQKENKQDYALKLMQPHLSPEMQKQFRDEMVNLQRLCAAEKSFGTCHIPRIIESSDLQQPKTQQLLQLLRNPFIIMDYAQGTDVETLLLEKTRLPEAEALAITHQFAQVLAVIHGEGFTYTDMKLGNLIWHPESSHLTVIDWNVITQNKLAEDAPWDRLRAAAYLFHMVTGFPITLNKSITGLTDQKYRRGDSMKNLSAGTRNFLIKAFHPDPTSRHGEGGSQVQCTNAFLHALETQTFRFKLPTDQLVEKGRDALQDRQWQEAWEYLDLADRQADIETHPIEYAQLQEDLQKACDEAKKLGRNAFFSGHGRYNNGLYPDALDDFERAMRDDPYDQEARLYAIFTRFARDIENQGEDFTPYREPLEDCARALAKEHLELAGNTLNRLPASMHTNKAIASLKAEIKVRIAVQKGQQLLKKDLLEEAQENFRTAYNQRASILYVEPLEENLGSLTQLCQVGEDLKKLFQEGKAYLDEEQFQDAAWAFWKARQISQGSPFANQNYQMASRFHTIKRLIENENLERALEECNLISSRFGDDPIYKILKTRVIDHRCEQLRELADETFKKNHFKSSKEHIREILKWKPNDEAAKVKLADIQKEIDGQYQEK